MMKGAAMIVCSAVCTMACPSSSPVGGRPVDAGASIDGAIMGDAGLSTAGEVDTAREAAPGEHASGDASLDENMGTASDGRPEEQCSRPRSLGDGGDHQCRVARMYVVCTDPSGAGCGCLSDDAKRCPGCGSDTGFTCRSVCGTDEYAVACGGVPAPGGTGMNPELPKGCRAPAVLPSGTTVSCCPCQ